MNSGGCALTERCKSYRLGYLSLKEIRTTILVSTMSRVTLMLNLSLKEFNVLQSNRRDK